MTFETIDWEAEAKRVAAAFGVRCRCSFKGRHSPYESILYLTRGQQTSLHLSDGYCAAIYYRQTNRQFAVYGKWEQLESEVGLGWSGELLNVYQRANKSDRLIKGLYHLDLLTPEVEAALEITVSSHQKLEWTLDYVKRMKSAG